MTNDPLDLDALVGAAPKPTKSGKKLESNLVRPGVSQQQVSQAKGKSLVAGREPKSIRIPPDLREQIDAEAKAAAGYKPIGPAAGCGIFDLYHLLIAYAWEEYKAGRLPVNVTEQVQVRSAIEIPGYS